MDLLAAVDMHGIQTSGNCIRNITSDALAGIAPGRDRRSAPLLRDPAPVEHAAPRVRLPAAQVQDRRHRRRGRPRRDRLARHRPAPAARTRPARSASRCWWAAAWAARRSSARVIREFLPWQQILVFIEADRARLQPLRPARQHVQGAHQDPREGRGPEVHRRGGSRIRATSSSVTTAAPRTLIPQAEFDRVAARFVPPAGRRAAPRPVHEIAAPATRPTRPTTAGCSATCTAHQHRRLPRRDPVAQARWARRPATPPATRWTLAAELADRFCAGELRVTHDQNLLLPWVHQDDLPALWHAARKAGFATPNIGLLTDMIACPGGDFCALANARSIPIAAAITERFDDLDELLRHRRHRPAHQRLHQLLRPPSQRPHRHPRRRQGRQGVVPGHARRLRRLARCRARRARAR